ncbi:MAG TPA: HEAT repeat domain-containing protein [Pyrinomonadaceae bacterium]|nr:HEAT repeat domain-containing protein [Pyrinomonadaceae bacterium]
MTELDSSRNAWFYDKSFGKFIGSVGKGEKEIHRIILNYAVHSDKSHRILAPFTLAEGWHDDAQTLRLLHDRAVNDESNYVRIAALGILVTRFRDDAQTLSLLRDCAVNDEDEDVRSRAVGVISELYP